MENVVVILPSLNPDEKLNLVVDGLLREGFEDIVIVNDGSDGQHLAPFERAASHSEVTVLTHEVNKGKGRALKTAFAYCLEHRKSMTGVVTVDGDNQHTPKDIHKCVEQMVQDDKVVLGCRDFSLEGIPFKSRFGNRLTSSVFRMLCGIRLSDTQTGLRAIPARFLPLLCEARGERFEYETEMLLTFQRESIPFEEVTIETVYLEENASTHFDPIRDSLKIYGIIFRYVFSSFSSFLVDYAIFSLLVFLLDGKMERGTKLLLATFAARVVSSLYNYSVNRKLVFHSKASVGSSLARYYILCAVQTAASYGLVFLLSALCHADSVLEIIWKLVVDTVLFLLSFRIQQAWVFRRKNV